MDHRSAGDAGDALANFGALHRRVAPGFVVDVVLEPGARIVTFGSGMVARELLLGADPEARRIACSLQNEASTIAQVVRSGARGEAKSLPT